MTDKAELFFLTALSTGGFRLCEQLVSRLSSTIVPLSKAYLTLDRRRQKTWDLFGVSLTHATGIFLISCYALRRLLVAPEANDETENTTFHRTTSTLHKRLLCVMMGYFLHDFFSTRDVWMKEKANSIHHIVGITLVAAGMSAPFPLYKFIPHVTVIEGSTIFLNLSWFQRELAKVDPSRPSSFLSSFIFATSFFLLRVCWLPFFTFALRRKYRGDLRALYNIHYALWLACALQLYWFTGIVKKVMATIKKIK